MGQLSMRSTAVTYYFMNLTLNTISSGNFARTNGRFLPYVSPGVSHPWISVKASSGSSSPMASNLTGLSTPSASSEPVRTVKWGAER